MARVAAAAMTPPLILPPRPLSTNPLKGSPWDSQVGKVEGEPKTLGSFTKRPIEAFQLNDEEFVPRRRDSAAAHSATSTPPPSAATCEAQRDLSDAITPKEKKKGEL